MGEALDVTKLPAGTVLMNKYRVKRTLGVGGMGAVVAADHLQLGTTVAIKLLLPSLVHNDQVVRRFLQEAKAATRIRSPHVAQVIDVGQVSTADITQTTLGATLPDGGVPYMVMEYLKGRDLSEWVRMGKKFPVADAIDYVVQAAEALAQAHKVGIIHRDIKPANLYLAELEEGNIVKVLDFGISKLMDEQPEEMGLTKTTTVLGSGLYMSPEQMRSAKNVDFRTDIYSLGVCLYELLTGTQPHTAETFSELCVKVNIDPPTPLRDYRPDISEDLAQAIAMAYARKPEERYQSVQDFVYALAPFADGGSVPIINQIQSITRHESIAPPPARPKADSMRDTRSPVAPEGLARTGAAVTAEAKPLHTRPRSSAVVYVTAAVAAILIAAGAGLLVMKRQAAAPPLPEPPAPATLTTATSTPSAPPTIVPSTVGTVTTPPSATATTAPRPTSRKQPPPTPPPVKPPPMKNCTRLNPDTGLMEVYPCPG